MTISRRRNSIVSGTRRLGFASKSWIAAIHREAQPTAGRLAEILKDVGLSGSRRFIFRIRI